MKLLLDIGNTRIKSALLDDGSALSFLGAVQHRGRELDALWSEMWSELAQPRRVLVSSVAGPMVNDSLATWVAAHWRVTPEFVAATPATLGLVNGYRRPSQLGVDRWMAMVGARAMPGFDSQGLCIIGCGTALTIDLVSTTGQHRGGWIAPGIYLMFSALQNGTAAVNVDRERAVSLSDFAVCTEDGVAAGIVNSVVGLISRALSAAETTLGIAPACIVTGGDAPRLLPYLPSETLLVEDLVLRGLAAVAGAGEAD